MKKLLVFALMWGILVAARAHDPNIATFHLELTQQVGMLSLSMSQSELQQALELRYTADSVQKLDQRGYEALLASYLRSHIQVFADQYPLKIEEVGVRLGTHQSDLKVILTNVPEKFNSLRIVNTAFSENPYHQSFFWLMYHGKKEMTILSKANDFTSTWRIEPDGGMVLKSPPFFSPEYVFAGLLGLVVAVMIGGMVFQKRKVLSV